MSLGLDLRGGVYFLYEVDVQGAVKQLLAGMETRLPPAVAQRAHSVHRRIASNGVDTVKIDCAAATM
jgi:preprotein translocase subunit SecD